MCHCRYSSLTVDIYVYDIFKHKFCSKECGGIPESILFEIVFEGNMVAAVSSISCHFFSFNLIELQLNSTKMRKISRKKVSIRLKVSKIIIVILTNCNDAISNYGWMDLHPSVKIREWRKVKRHGKLSKLFRNVSMARIPESKYFRDSRRDLCSSSASFSPVLRINGVATRRKKNEGLTSLTHSSS